MNTETESTLAVTSVLPGVYHDMPNDAYHGTSAISNTGLRNLAKSPFHFYSLHRDPSRPPQAAKPGQLEGTLAHCAVLEPLQFGNRYVIGPDVRANTNEWKAFVERHRAKTVIKADQHEAAHAQARSVRQIADVAELLSAGHAEVSAYWNEDLVDALTGESTRVLCRCRPDWVHPVNDDSVILVDLKTCSDASPWEFARQIKRKSYHGQNAFYKRGYEKATGKKVLGFVFVAVESAWPYASAPVMLNDSDVEQGDAQNQRLLQLYVKCMSEDTWPSYTQGIVPVSIPNYSN